MWKIKAKNGEDDSVITISDHGDAIQMVQDTDFVWLQDAKQARKVIKAIRKAAKRNGWEV